jgi:septal ring factor EnvC (AmiA/AmiB activator)
MTPVVVTPNDSHTLRELCSRSEAAISSLDEQVSMLVAKTTMQKQQQEKLETDLLADAQQVSELGDQIKETEGRIQQDAVARMEQEQRAGNFASELRASTRKPINKSVWPGAKRCKFCGASGRNVATHELHLLCHACNRKTWRWP